MTPNPQDSAVALEVERAIREALDAGPTPGPWLSAGATVYSLTEDRARSGPVNRFSAGFQSARQPWEAQANELISNARLVVACNPEAMRTLLAELDRLRSASRQEGWQPIETAPKDGVLSLFCDMKAEQLRDTFFVDWMVGGAFCGNRQHRATHHMPLPAAPHQSQEAQGDRHGE